MSEEHQPILVFAKEELSHIYVPLETTRRIKYTCFNVSQNFLVFGATSGGLYVFKRDPCLFLQLLPNKEGAITHLSISPSEKLFAFSTVKGTVCILERNVGPGARLVQVSREHRNSDVTALQWNSENSELYIGDNLGRISILSILMLISKNLFNMPTFMLMQLDSPIVQLDWRRNLLLVSTMSRCYVCNTYKEEFWQIGTKLRDGEYGACFFNVNNETGDGRSATECERTGNFTSVSLDLILGDLDDESFKDAKIFCARPGFRLWEADINGTVRNTHELKHALAAAPTKIINIHCTDRMTNSLQSEKSSKQSVNFSKLCILANKYLFTFKRDGIYIIDPLDASVVLWNKEFGDIIGCKVFQDIVYIRLSNGRMHALTLLSVESLLIGLYLRKNFRICADLCCQHLDYLSRRIATCPKLHLLIDLEDKLSKEEELIHLSPFFQELSNYHKVHQINQKLKSGIFLVGNKYSLLNNVQQSELLATERETAVKIKSQRRARSLDCSRSNKHSSLPELPKSTSFQTFQDVPSLLESSHFQLQEKQNSEETEREVDDFFNKELLSSVTSSETVQAFKYLSLTVTDKITTGRKSLRETWQTLEDKMKFLTQDVHQEPFDIKASSDQSEFVHSEREQDLSNVAVNARQLAQCYPSKQVPFYPLLNTSQVMSICDQLTGPLEENEDANHLLFTLYQNINLLNEQYEYFCSANQAEAIQDTSHVSFRNNPFPFKFYFPSKYTKIIQEYFTYSLSSKILVKILEELLPGVIANHSMTPEYLFTAHSGRCLDIDYLLSIHLTLFAELLNPLTIIDDIRSSGISCYYISLCRVLDLYEIGALQLSLNAGENSSERALPSLLNAMFWVLKMGQPETCLKMGEFVPLKDILYLVLRLQYYFIDSGIEAKDALLECQKLFLSYVDNIEDYAFITAALGDIELRQYINIAFEYVNMDSTNQSCTCGFPFPSSAMTGLQYQNIGHLLSNYYWKSNRKKLYELASKIPVMWLLIIQHRTDDRITDILPLILHIGDVKELADRLPHFDRNLWEVTLDLFVKLQSGTCLNCCKRNELSECFEGITWTSLGLLMIQSLGGIATLDVMVKYEFHIPTGALDRMFYQSCIVSSITKIGTIARDTGPAFVGNALDSSENGLCLVEQKPWRDGSNLANAICPCCSLPLSHRSLLADGGLTYFSCQHTYHTACLPQHTKLLCLLCTNM